MKNTVIAVVVVLLSLTFLPAFYTIINSQAIELEKKVVPYQLPFPGLLPGHPLYFLKTVRDKILLFTTRENLKKANLYLHLSDKNMSTALALANAGKEQSAVSQLMTGENRFLEIVPVLLNLKKQGGAYPYDLVIELQQSNLKHKETIAEVISKATETEIATLNSLLEKNNKAQMMIKKLE